MTEPLGHESCVGARGVLDDVQPARRRGSEPPRAQERNAAPSNRTRDDARRTYEAACDELRNHDRITRWNYLPERLHAVEKRIDALDTWHRWATGSTASREDLAAAVHLLGRGDDAADQSLAGLTHQWARSHSIDLSPPRAPAEITNAEVSGIEIDL